MSNVREVEFAPPKQNEEVVEMLEEWLQRARDGKVQVVGLAGVKPDGTIATEWRGLSNGGLHELNSAISIMQYRILAMNVQVD